MPAISFSVKAEGLVQVVENRFLEYVEDRVGKTTPRLLELRAPRSGFLGESVAARTHEQIKRRIDSLPAVQNYEAAVAKSSIFSSAPSGYVSPASRVWAVGPGVVEAPPSHLRAYDQAVRLVPFELTSPAFWASSSVGFDQIQDVFAHLDTSYRLLTPPPCGLRVEVGVGEPGMRVEAMRRLAALAFATGRLTSQLQPGRRRARDGACLNSRYYSRVATGCTAQWACERVRAMASHTWDAGFRDDDFPLPEAAPLPTATVPLPSAADPNPTPFQRVIRRGTLSTEPIDLNTWTATCKAGPALPDAPPGPVDIDLALQEILRCPSAAAVAQLMGPGHQTTVSFTHFEVITTADGDRKPVVEFRQAAGTFAPEAVACWARLCVYICQAALFWQPEELATLIRRCEQGDVRPDRYDVLDLMVDLGLGAEANMMQQHIINSLHSSPFTDVFELTQVEESG